MTPEQQPGQPVEAHRSVGDLNQPTEEPKEIGTPPPESPLLHSGDEILIVDIATIEQEHDERRRDQNREAQRRWRQNHPEEHRQQVRDWYQKPDVKERKAAYQRRRRLSRKLRGQSTEDPASPFPFSS